LCTGMYIIITILLLLFQLQLLLLALVLSVGIEIAAGVVVGEVGVVEVEVVVVLVVGVGIGVVVSLLLCTSQCTSFINSRVTKPDTAAVVVAIAGVILPAISLTWRRSTCQGVVRGSKGLSRSCQGIERRDARGGCQRSVRGLC